MLERATYVIFPDKAQGKASFFWHLTMQIHSCYIIPHLHPSLTPHNPSSLNSPFPAPLLFPSASASGCKTVKARLIKCHGKRAIQKKFWINRSTSSILYPFKLKTFFKANEAVKRKAVNAKGGGECELCRVQSRWIWAPPNNSLTQEISICVFVYCTFFF